MKDIPEEFKNLNIIIGEKPYKDKDKVKCETRHLKGTKCYIFYKKFLTVAFVTCRKKPFKHTFENILTLLYFQKNRNVRKKYVKVTKNNNWKKFVNNMFEKEKIVFINANEIDEKDKTIIEIFNNSNAILMCGEDARNKVQSIINFNKKLNLFYSLHPSPRTHSNPRYSDDWIFIKTKGSYTDTKKNTYSHSTKNFFMV